MLPQNWKIKTVSELAAITTGKRDTQNKIEGGKYPFYVRSQTVERIDSYSFDGVAVLTAGDGVGVGKVFHFVDGKFDFHQRVYKISDFSPEIDPGYFFEYFKQNFIREVCKYTAKTSVDSVRMEMIANMEIPLPSLKEQIKIAKILSTWDELIEKQTKLIELKEKRKKALMQKLLTGEVRFNLNGSGKWQRNKIKSFAKVSSGGTPNTKKKEFWNGQIRWMNSGELNLKVVNEVQGRITELGLLNSSTKIIPKHCVLIGLAGQGKTRGTVAFNTIELCTNQSIAAIFPNETTNYKYLYYNLDFRYDELRGLSTGDGGRGGLNLSIINNIEIEIPSLEEQAKIASLLTACDLEIDSLENELSLIRQQKNGLMQQLLTGKIRVKI